MGGRKYGVNPWVATTPPKIKYFGRKKHGPQTHSKYNCQGLQHRNIKFRKPTYRCAYNCLVIRIFLRGDVTHCWLVNERLRTKLNMPNSKSMEYTGVQFIESPMTRVSKAGRSTKFRDDIFVGLNPLRCTCLLSECLKEMAKWANCKFIFEISRVTS